MFDSQTLRLTKGAMRFGFDFGTVVKKKNKKKTDLIWSISWKRESEIKSRHYAVVFFSAPNTNPWWQVVSKKLL